MHTSSSPAAQVSISQPQFGDEELSLIREVLESGFVVQGPKVEQLEREFAELAGTRFAVAVANGTAALHLALLAHEIGPGDEVITTPFTFIGSANAALFVGATPRFVDIRPDTFNIDPTLIETAITPRTRAIMPVHLYGLMADMDPIVEIARRHNLVIVEDAAQAHGASYKGRPAGSIGTGCFSLYATKNMNSAEGGMVTTNDSAIAERVRLLRAHGMRERYHHEMLGFNLRMSDLHAAVGLAQLHKLADANERRRANAAFLGERISRVVTPYEPEGYHHVWHQYTIRLTNVDRDRAIEQLREAGVGVGVFYPVPVHQQKVYRDRGYDDVLPVAEAAAREVLSLPVHPALTESDLERIVAAVESL